MSKFNVTDTRSSVRSPIQTERTPSGKTFEGGAGYARDAKSELFLLAVSNMVGEATFYESADGRDSRFVELVRQCSLDDPQWTSEFLRWLRGDGNMRSASVVGAAEFVKARLDRPDSPSAASVPDGLNRQVIESVLQRPDEPGEILAYWTSQYGRAIPKPVKRGVGDAVRRMYSERNLLKYDTASHGFRFGDVIELVHPSPAADKPWQGELFQFAIERRRDRVSAKFDSSHLYTVMANSVLRLDASEDPTVLLDADRLSRAGMTWEDALSLAGNRVDKARLWECLGAGTPIWLPDGRTVPVERVIAEQLPVLSYDREWDMREPTSGRPYPSRDQSTGDLVPSEPIKWIDSGPREVFTVRFASGRVIEATAGHRWAVRMRTGARRPLWRTTEQLQPGWSAPVALNAGFFGSLGDELDGWFIGSMLGDGSMTGRTPAWSGQDDGTLAAIREYAAKHGCTVTVTPQNGCIRASISDPVWHQNAVRDELIAHGVWGLRVERKSLAERPYSRAFVLGAIAGLIDSDGSVSSNTVEFAVISEVLARQFADMLLKVGVLSTIDSRENDKGYGETAFRLWRVRVADSASVSRLADLIELRSERKAAALAALAGRVIASRRTATGVRGYPENIAWDRIVSITQAGIKPTYCVEVGPSHLWVANGVVTGNCMIPSMGIMALARNLRNFDEAGVSDSVAATVSARFADAEQVAKSRMFPFRWLAAYRHAPSLRWGHALDQALTASLSNVPTLTGRTLILVDISGSMDSSAGGKMSDMKRSDVAGVFGAAIAMRTDPTLVWFHTSSGRVDVPKGGSLLKLVESIPRPGGGTYTSAAVQRWYAGHDRVIIITDEQSHDGGGSQFVPAHIPMYVWNVAGYQHGQMASGTSNRHVFTGLNDAGFRMVPLLENRAAGTWPWLAQD